jgi:uncharacterized membrane protein
MQGFPPIAFQSSLGTGAILFGVFGFLYTIFATLAFNNNHRPPIINTIRLACRLVALLCIVNAVITLCSLVLLNDMSMNDWLVGWGLVFVAAATAIISVWMSFWTM